jgi:hypothetical protein
MLTCRGMRCRVRFVRTCSLGRRTAPTRGFRLRLSAGGLRARSFRLQRSGRRSGFLRVGRAGQHAGAQQRRSATGRQAPASSYRPTLLFQTSGPSKVRNRQSPQKQNPTETRIVIIPYCKGQCQFPLGSGQVTEVFPPRRWCHPAVSNRAGAPGKPHPGRSSGSIPPWRNPLRCLPAVCSLPRSRRRGSN